MTFLLILAIIIAYVLGSINSAILISNLTGLPDPRKSGSGNPGATNMLRIAGRNMAAITLAADALKGLIPVLIGIFFGLAGFALALVALVTVIGHIFPVFFNFQGGKGIATLFGSVIGLNIIVAILFALIWVGVALFSRYASLASLVAAVATPILFLFVNTGYFIPLLVATALLIWTHLENIQHLRDGTEKKIGE